jgi:hypothetical protein
LIPLPSNECINLLSPPTPEVAARHRIVRPDDLLVADLVFHNLSITPARPSG